MFLRIIGRLIKLLLDAGIFIILGIVCLFVGPMIIMDEIKQTRNQNAKPPREP